MQEGICHWQVPSCIAFCLQLFAVKFINCRKESVDVVPAGHRRDIAAGGNDKIRMGAELLHDIQRCPADRLRRAVAELTCRIDIAHADGICRNLRQDFSHIDSIAEMIGICTAGQDRIQRYVCGVAAIVVNECKVFVAYSIYDLLAVVTGELLSQCRRQQACERLSHGRLPKMCSTSSAMITSF